MRKVLISLALVCVLGLSTCDNEPPSTGTPAPTAISTATSAAVDPGFNLLIVVDGQVQLKRDGKQRGVLPRNPQKRVQTVNSPQVCQQAVQLAHAVEPKQRCSDHQTRNRHRSGLDATAIDEENHSSLSALCSYTKKGSCAHAEAPV